MPSHPLSFNIKRKYQFGGALILVGFFAAAFGVWAISERPVTVWELRSCKTKEQVREAHAERGAPASMQVPALPGPGDFTVAVIPDTQFYCKTFSGFLGWPVVGNIGLESAVDWILRNRDRQNIVFANHEGDIVNLRQDDQWEVARQQLGRVIDAGLPLGLSAGNHDIGNHSSNSLQFQHYFPARLFEDFPWYGGTFPPDRSGAQEFGNNTNSYQLFEAEGVKMLVLNLACNTPQPVLDWADDVLSEHADRYAVVVAHMWLGTVQNFNKDKVAYAAAPKGRMRWKKCYDDGGLTPQETWDSFIRRHPNIRLVLSGDQRQAQTLRIASVGDAGNPIHEMMLDHGGGRYIRLLTFRPAAGIIDVVTWDTILEQPLQGTKLIPDTDQWQFSLPFVPVTP